MEKKEAKATFKPEDILIRLCAKRQPSDPQIYARGKVFRTFAREHLKTGPARRLFFFESGPNIRGGYFIGRYAVAFLPGRLSVCGVHWRRNIKKTTLTARETRATEMNIKLDYDQAHDIYRAKVLLGSFAEQIWGTLCKCSEILYGDKKELN